MIGEFPAQRASNAEMFPFDDVFMVMVICLRFRNSGSTSELGLLMIMFSDVVLFSQYSSYTFVF